MRPSYLWLSRIKTATCAIALNDAPQGIGCKQKS